jgi:lycopene beta-cyclase
MFNVDEKSTMQSSNQQYDIIVVGNGLSGWMLLEAMSKYDAFADLRVLLLSEGGSSERSWCFWDAELESPYREMVEAKWSRLAFHSGDFRIGQRMEAFQYQYIPGESFFKYFDEVFLPAHPNICMSEDKVLSIQGADGGFVVEGANRTYLAPQVYNSAILKPGPAIDIWQHFRGWFIEMPSPVFNTGEAVLMDFNVPQENGCSFIYLLPLSETRALVELTFFSPHTFEAARYDDELARYISERFGHDYKVFETEQGKIPMQQGVFQLTGPSGEINIGTLAGMVKASTGFAFQRIRRDSAALAEAYFKGVSVSRLSENDRFALYDKLLLRIIREHPEACQEIFTRLFKYTEMERILRFMDERTGLWEEVGIFLRLPRGIFLKALWRNLFSDRFSTGRIARPTHV